MIKSAACAASLTASEYFGVVWSAQIGSFVTHPPDDDDTLTAVKYGPCDLALEMSGEISTGGVVDDPEKGEGRGR